MKFGIFYGTLRKGEFNFGRCGNQTYIKTFRLEGYDLYDCGLPIVMVGDGSITVELHSIDEQTDARIRGMELGAGYKEVKITVEEGTSFQIPIEASLYVYPNMENMGWRRAKLVKSGDWLNKE